VRGIEQIPWLYDLPRSSSAHVRLTAGCHPNRETEAAVEAAGFAIDPSTRRARGDMRRFEARPRS
jgi:hypothetical protein